MTMIGLTAGNLDMSGLMKGDYLSPALIEDVTGETEGTTGYQLALLNLKERIVATLADLAKTERSDGTLNPDRLVTLKVEGGGLRILTDPEAAVYNKVQGEAAVRKLRHANRRNLLVDESKLSDGERQGHYRTLEVQGRYLQAIRKVNRDLTVEPAKRRTPGV
jgi:hypothetical protein